MKFSFAVHERKEIWSWRLLRESIDQIPSSTVWVWVCVSEREREREGGREREREGGREREREGGREGGREGEREGGGERERERRREGGRETFTHVSSNHFRRSSCLMSAGWVERYLAATPAYNNIMINNY